MNRLKPAVLIVSIVLISEILDKKYLRLLEARNNREVTMRTRMTFSRECSV